MILLVGIALSLWLVVAKLMNILASDLSGQMLKKGEAILEDSLITDFIVGESKKVVYQNTSP